MRRRDLLAVLFADVDGKSGQIAAGDLPLVVGFNFLGIMEGARAVPGGLNLILYGDPESEGDRLGGDR